MIYKAIGKAVVKMAIYYFRRQYGVQLRFLAGFGAAALAIGAYLASRGVAEG
jgi:uncharacterized membrane protein YhfC